MVSVWVTEDDFKGVVHAVAGGLLIIMGAYNLMRWCATRNRRNAVNALIYIPMAVREVSQVHYHWHCVAVVEHG